MTKNQNRTSWTKLTLALVAGMALSACRTVGPNYNRPGISVPPVYRGANAAEQPHAGAATFGDQPWPEVFQDTQLQQLIRMALQNNFDVRIAAARILQAEAQLGVRRADGLPTLDAGADASNQRIARSSAPAFETNQLRLSMMFSWELDFWGKFRRASEAARARLLANDWARQAVISSLVGDLASSYFQLRELDLELAITNRTLASRQESLQLIQTLADQGLGTMLDVRQAEQLVFTAGARIPDIERQIAQEENLISILVGTDPGAIARGKALEEQLLIPLVPPGLPSSLLERRPDIRLAEQELIAFNAQIGVAKAAYFPRISLTGLGGFQSSSLLSLLSGPAGMWNLAGGLAQPVFTGGRLRSEVQYAEAQQQEALLAYQQTIQQAFREVSDALVGYRKYQEFRQQQEQLARSAQDATELAGLRYRAGLTSYLEVLTNETNYFSAELGLAQSRSKELLAIVQLYRALGGGWQN